MAINEILNNLNPMVHTELAVTTDAQTITIPTQPNVIDFCHCFFECEYIEKKFASPGNEEYKNDKSNYLYELVDSSGTIVFKLYKNDVLQTTITDDTLGTYYSVGSLPNSEFTDHSLKSGFIADWELIYNTYGRGLYYLEIDVTNFSRTVTYTTHKYRLALFNVKLADNTFVIKTTQNGYIVGGMDYTGLEWAYEYRIDGKLLPKVPDYEKSIYLDSNRIEKQIQSQVIRTYELTMNMIPSEVADFLIEDNIMSNVIRVTDYSIWNQKSLTYAEKTLVLDSIEEVEYFARSRKGIYKFGMREAKQDKLKRNFK